MYVIKENIMFAYQQNLKRTIPIFKKPKNNSACDCNEAVFF